MRSIVMMLPVLLIVGCASKKSVSGTSTVQPQTSTTTNDTPVQSQTSKTMNDSTPITRADTLPLIVEFYSIGEGVKSEPKTRLDGFIKDYEKILKQSISYQVISWGREGEYDACFRLANLNEEQRHTFIAELKKLYDEKSMVHVLENQTCQHIR
ncbi:MAG: hypothetical protein ABI723_26605 [Bacteroidia bacterium]